LQNEDKSHIALLLWIQTSVVGKEIKEKYAEQLLSAGD